MYFRLDLGSESRSKLVEIYFPNIHPVYLNMSISLVFFGSLTCTALKSTGEVQDITVSGKIYSNSFLIRIIPAFKTRLEKTADLFGSWGKILWEQCSRDPKNTSFLRLYKTICVGLWHNLRLNANLADTALQKMFKTILQILLAKPK